MDLEGGPYFLFLDGLYLRPWKERFNPKMEDMKFALVWIRLLSLPCKYWDLKIMQNIGNTIGEFVNLVRQMKQQRYTAFAHICVYMDLSKEL